MAEEPDKIGSIEDPKEGGELLSIVMRFGGVPESSILRELRIDVETARVLEQSLTLKGWIKPPDYSVSDPMIELSDDYEKKMKAFKKSILDQSIPEASTVDDPAQADETSKPKEHKPRLSGTTAYDLMVLISMVLSGVLAVKWLKNPSSEIPALIAGVLLFFLAFVILRIYRPPAASKNVVDGGDVKPKSPSALSVFKEIIKRRIKHIIMSGMLLLVFFFLGRFVFTRDPLNLILLIIPLASVPIIFLRSTTLGFLVRYYLGMVGLTYAILLFIGLYSASEPILGGKLWIFDFLAGFLIIVFIQLSEKKFGVGISFVSEWAKRQQNQSSK